ncbi:sigma factor-like helix-turn-helix DNA-binding protein [uncultured Traorella sp.]|uniref:sigma factor-like helix-turn-helix DNA-binding protein n=1 Tax=uncultured Traorella sp. TaxID=1929048 RepID=UPI0025E9F996|nr:sigma factor-like helix-turn-helix DNA-binding protein [uncultured Traorella sp.]
MVLYSYEKGYRLFNEQEKEVLELRYHKNYSQQMTADTMKYSLARIQQLEASLIGKMVNAMIF